MNRNAAVRLLRPAPAPLKPPASELRLYGEGLDAIIQLTRSGDRYWFDRFIRMFMPRFLHRDVILPTPEDRAKRYRDAFALFATGQDRAGFEYRAIIGEQFQKAWLSNHWPRLCHIAGQMPRRSRAALKVVRA